MSSPGGRRRPLSTSGYEPLLPLAGMPSNEKPKPPPKPSSKPPFKKSSSSVGVLDSFNHGSDGYFQPGGGGSNFGYCLSSIYKASSEPRKDPSDVSSFEAIFSDTKATSDGDVLSTPDNSRKKLAHRDSTPPPLSSLPAKFRISFEERNKKSLTKSFACSDPTTGVLITTADDAHKVTRRQPPPIPRNSNHRLSTPLFFNSDRSQLSNSNIPSPIPSSTKILKSQSLERNSEASFSNTDMVPLISPGSTKPITFAQPPPHELEYVEREYPRNAYTNMERFRKHKELCDATFIVNDKEMYAHRVVMAACSHYFESMFLGEFAEPANEAIIIEELSDDSVEAIINFAYTSRITITEKNVYSIFEAADLLQFTGIKGACFKFFKQQMNKSNCIRTWLFAESHNCTELLDASLMYMECNFLDIVKGREFLDLDDPSIVVAIASREDLAITAEEQVYEAVLSWVHHKLGKRGKQAYEVFRSVRFPSMSKEYLMNIVDTEPVIKDDPDLLQLLIDALESHTAAMRGTLKKKKSKHEHQSYAKPRSASMAVEVVNFARKSATLGLRVMGGTDRPQHVFRQGDKPGVFILQILKDSIADRVKKLRTGDRILQVNDVDMSTVTHDEAIRVLRTCSDPLTFLVRHEPPPPGLNELTLVTKPGEGFGFVIAGGVNELSGNPMDDTDEGIFVAQIIPGGTADHDGRLKVGTRILQVNSVSMLGKTHEEALKVLQGVLDRINLLVCHGFDPDLVAQATAESEAYV